MHVLTFTSSSIMKLTKSFLFSVQNDSSGTSLPHYELQKYVFSQDRDSNIQTKLRGVSVTLLKQERKILGNAYK